MPIQGAIQSNHNPLNRYTLMIPGMPPITFITLSGIEQELETVELPDRTTASGGNLKPYEITAQTAEHHLVEEAAMENWFAQAQVASPGYKKTGTLIKYSIDGKLSRSYTLIGIYPSKRKQPDLDIHNEGEMAVTEWTIKGDSLLPIF